MQDIREIYAETLTKLEAVRSRLVTERQELDYINRDIQMVESQIKIIETFLASNPV